MSELTVNGRTMSVSDWAREAGVGAGHVFNRLRAGMTPEEATFPFHIYRSREGSSTGPGGPGSSSWQLLEWANDANAQALVREHKDGMECSQIGVAFGLSRMGVLYVLHDAIAKLRIAERIVSLLGPVHGQRRIEALRGDSVATYEAELAAVERNAGGAREAAE